MKTRLKCKDWAKIKQGERASKTTSRSKRRKIRVRKK